MGFRRQGRTDLFRRLFGVEVVAGATLFFMSFFGWLFVCDGGLCFLFCLCVVIFVCLMFSFCIQEDEVGGGLIRMVL